MSGAYGAYIAPPLEIVFPEQLALSDAIAGSRRDVAASEFALGAVNKKVNTNKTAIAQAVADAATARSELDSNISELQSKDSTLEQSISEASTKAAQGVSKGDAAQAKADSAYALAQDAKATALSGLPQRNIGAVDTYVVAMHTNYIVNGLKSGQNVSGGNLTIAKAGSDGANGVDRRTFSGVWKLMSEGTASSGANMSGLFLRIS